MKKILLLSAFFVLSLHAFSQNQGVRIGLNFSPAISLNRVVPAGSSNPVNYSNNSAGIRFIAGPEIYFFLSKQFAITTGLWYSSMREGFKFQSKNGDNQGNAYYNLQSLQVPVTMRLYTDEVITNMRIYFQLGLAGNIVLKAKQYKTDSTEQNAIKHFIPVNASLILASGVELKIGETNYLMLGLRYTRGLTNTIGSMNYNLAVINSKVDLFSLDLGIRF